MTVATYRDPEELYLARGEEVNPNRPLSRAMFCSKSPSPSRTAGSPSWWPTRAVSAERPAASKTGLSSPQSDPTDE